jgi:NAD(P)-dependent dehydrogenase (short-subunit alcohol dehydrogenase family)
MARYLEGKSAVITGSGSGIGRVVALFMASQGARVVVNDIGKNSDGRKSADIVVDEIKKANGIAVANYDSVATMAGGENLINTAVKNFGRIDALVNTAGNFKVAKTVADLTENDWDATMSLHLKGHFSCIKSAVPEMKRQGGGRIINVSSGAAFQTGTALLFPAGLPISMAAYGTAKAGILGLTTCLALELKQFGIGVNAILPSAVTPLFPGERERLLGGPTGSPEAIAPIVAYLATDNAKDITGQFIYTCAGDFCIFSQPFQIPGDHVFIRKMDNWTMDELVKVFPPLMGHPGTGSANPAPLMMKEE